MMLKNTIFCSCRVILLISKEANNFFHIASLLIICFGERLCRFMIFWKMKAHHGRIWKRQVRECLNSLVSGILSWWFLLIPFEPNFIRSRNRQIVCQKYFEYLFEQNTEVYTEAMMPPISFHHYLYKPRNLAGRLLNTNVNCERTCVWKFPAEVLRSHLHTCLSGRVICSNSKVKPSDLGNHHSRRNANLKQ